jgi:hypothetical protein
VPTGDEQVVQPPIPGPRGRRLGRRVALALAPLVVVGAACGVVQVRRASRLESITKAAEAESHPLILECRWERPVVGGAARDCNGVDVAQAAVDRLFGDAPEGMMAKASLLAALEQDRPLPADVASFVESHGKALDEVREATRCSWACVRDVPRTHFRRGSLDAATDLLLFSARAATPEACLSIAIDVMRLVQDGETGLSSAFVSRETSREPRHLHEARRTLLECGRRAGGPLLAEAARRTALVATTPPPVGDALATDALVIATALLEDVGHPDRPGAENVLWVQRGGLLDLAGALVARMDTYRSYRDDDLPASFDRLSHDLPPRPWVPLADHKPSGYSPSVGEVLDAPQDLRDVLRGHAHVDRDLRATAVALAALRDRVAGGAWSDAGPAERARPELRDPFTGQPFGWSLAPAGPILLAEAVGEVDAEAIGLPEPAP